MCLIRPTCPPFLPRPLSSPCPCEMLLLQYPVSMPPCSVPIAECVTIRELTVVRTVMLNTRCGTSLCTPLASLCLCWLVREWRMTTDSELMCLLPISMLRCMKGLFRKCRKRQLSDVQLWDMSPSPLKKLSMILVSGTLQVTRIRSVRHRTECRMLCPLLYSPTTPLTQLGGARTP